MELKVLICVCCESSAIEKLFIKKGISSESFLLKEKKF